MLGLLGPRQEKKRFLSGDEMLASQILPVTVQQAKTCGAPRLELQGINNNSRGKMAGNSMSTPCIGAMMLLASIALERR